MSQSGLEIFDRSLQATHVWLNEIMEELGADRQEAYQTLKTVLQALRDRLGVEEAASLGAQLPIMIRGIYFGEWHPGGPSVRDFGQENFLWQVEGGLKGSRPVDPEYAARVVFEVLERHVSRGELDAVKSHLPTDLKALCPGGWVVA